MTGKGSCWEWTGVSVARGKGRGLVELGVGAAQGWGVGQGTGGCRGSGQPREWRADCPGLVTCWFLSYETWVALESPRARPPSAEASPAGSHVGSRGGAEPLSLGRAPLSSPRPMRALGCSVPVPCLWPGGGGGEARMRPVSCSAPCCLSRSGGGGDRSSVSPPPPTGTSGDRAGPSASAAP